MALALEKWCCFVDAKTGCYISVTYAICLAVCCLILDAIRLSHYAMLMWSGDVTNVEGVAMLLAMHSLDIPIQAVWICLSQLMLLGTVTGIGNLMYPWVIYTPICSILFMLQLFAYIFQFVQPGITANSQEIALVILILLELLLNVFSVTSVDTHRLDLSVNSKERMTSSTESVQHPSSVSGSKLTSREGLTGGQTPTLRLPPGLSLKLTRPARNSSDDLTAPVERRRSVGGGWVGRSMVKTGSGTTWRGGRTLSPQGQGHRMSH